MFSGIRKWAAQWGHLRQRFLCTRGYSNSILVNRDQKLTCFERVRNGFVPKTKTKITTYSKISNSMHLQANFMINIATYFSHLSHQNQLKTVLSKFRFHSSAYGTQQDVNLVQNISLLDVIWTNSSTEIYLKLSHNLITNYILSS